MTIKALVIADDCPSTRRLCDRLTETGLAVSCAGGGEDWEDRLAACRFDVIVLDVAAEGGYERMSRLRRRGEKAAVMALVNTAEPAARTRALEMGADDCMTRPLDFAEGLARIRAIVRRASGFAHSLIQIGELEVDLSARTASVGGDLLDLTHKEYQVLEILTLRKGCIVTREALMAQLYGDVDWPDIKIVDVYVSRLRRKLSPTGGCGDYVHTAWSRGYRLACEGALTAVAA